MLARFLGTRASHTPAVTTAPSTPLREYVRNSATRSEAASATPAARSGRRKD